MPLKLRTAVSAGQMTRKKRQEQISKKIMSTYAMQSTHKWHNFAKFELELSLSFVLCFFFVVFFVVAHFDSNQ